MQFTPTPIADAVLVSTTRHEDDRGWFARAWCAEEFAEAGLPPLTFQANLSSNRAAFTLRGMHWQVNSDESKLVRPVHGAIHDVIVDLRPESATYRQWFGIDLDAIDAVALFVPAQCAHGFLTLRDDTLVHYMMGAPHEPDAARGFRWNDPDVGIRWPHEPAVVSERDAALPTLADR